ncbi:hypothetical protein DXG03_001653 [Asterophora parasitica]|uniref:Yeast cell wall synthesis Kre9/Knh1-like N-terminal domain-containing protein n=1 Tax=Asterophora parasitica TaxID=117018 RepID=A0A9P7G4Q1_9AGAR|nr:hypothetical protein DXG03_001653 [Asterophora parasitica]
MLYTRLAVAAAVAGAAVAEFQILSPGADVWWVAKSLNTLSWTCNDPSALATFTVLVANKDPKILTDPLAIIGVQNNFDCSKTITQDQLSAPAGTGYTIQFASTLNRTDVFATSQEFEIKPLGSSYPTSTPGLPAASPSTSGSGASSAPGANNTGTPSKDNNSAVASGSRTAAALAALAAAVAFAL